MERAGFHLLKGEMSITDIALSVAYGTPSSFCTVFKTHLVYHRGNFKIQFQLSNIKKQTIHFEPRSANVKNLYHSPSQ